MNLKFLFLDSTNTSGESQTFYCEEGDTLTLQVQKTSGGATLNIAVKVKSDIDGAFQTCGVVDLKDMSTKEAIEAEGMYLVPLSGILQLKVVNSGTAGNCKVFGVMTA